MESLEYTTEAVVAALSNTTDFVVIERKGRNDFHAFQVDLKALKSKGTKPGFIQQGALLGEAQAILMAAGYDAVDRGGFPGKDGWVSWPHLQILVPGTGYQAVNAAADARAKAQEAKIDKLIALLASTNPAAAAALADDTQDAVVVEATEPLGETNEESFDSQPAA